MSAAVENGVDGPKPRGVFSRAFAKRAQPFEEALNTLNRLNKEGEALALEDDLTTHPTLALMRRILADAQMFLYRRIVEELNNKIKIKLN
ncbi:hypothetical protein E2986_10640 [Frieseomelitta varia]|uniref:Uncharacterized protein n=1 Tax=Frieseomelitta varia TaxID=561572 RepID=A0A833S4P5_9HYME|nr:hypothetical protein E2986_10640 [Frieseomelitta varia]